ncbi:MAG: response regulator [Kiritimatiellae bacterium]|nr:response regulator [Kiritimatiellia bacterium]
MDADNRQTVDWSLLSQIVANVPILFYTKDAGEGAYRICNVKFADFCGKERPEDVIGLTPVELFDAETAAQFAEQDRQVIAAGHPLEFIEEGHDARGAVYQFKTIKSCFRSVSGQVCILGLSMDISRENSLLEELRRERDRAVAAERAKGYFLSAASHGIRTPLNAIIGFTELLVRGVEDPSKERRYLAAIQSSGRALMALVDDMLDLTRLELGKLTLRPEPVNLRMLVSEVVGAFSVDATRRGITLSAEATGIPYLALDPQRMRQLIGNLVDNALKFTEVGAVSVRVQYKRPRLVVEVEDTGVGIAPGDLAQVMEPFVQLQPCGERRGAGLGLPICREIASLMGGELTVVSEAGQGSVFTLTLPYVAEVNLDDVAACAASPARSKSVTQRISPFVAEARLRVLVVDDSAVNLSVMTALLSRLGVRDVTTAVDGRDALAKLGRPDEKRFDLILTDLWMPVMDGEGLVRCMFEEPVWREIPVVAVTADVSARRNFEEKGFSDLLVKPVTLDKLKALLGT